MYQPLSPKVEKIPGYFPIRMDTGTLEKTSELSSRLVEIITLTLLPIDQLPALTRTPNPIICNLYIISGELGCFFFKECKLFVSELANSHIKLLFFFLYCKLLLLHFFGPVRTSRWTQEKNGGVSVTLALGPRDFYSKQTH